MIERYKKIDGHTGEGGFGKVEKAYDSILEREVAIKILDPIFKVEPSETDLERFKSEAKVLAKLCHPNIPAIYDVSLEPEKKAFKIIFQWINGTTLFEIIQKRGSIPLDDLKKWFSSICSALSHAHQNGIIHRDIKPSNLIVTEDLESCYIVDFGIALNSAELKRLSGGIPIGTPGYMSQEQTRGEDLTVVSDVYSLGIVLYEALAGHRPLGPDYQPLSEMNEAIPQTIDNLIKECLQEKNERIQSPQEFLHILIKALKPNANFTRVLKEGSLFDIQASLEQMRPDEFKNLPVGQRRLLFSRLKDLINVDKEHLRSPVADLIRQMVRAAQLTEPNDYREVLDFALLFAYEKQYGPEWWGNKDLRIALYELALDCHEEAHSHLSTRVSIFCDQIEDFHHKEKWFTHDLRILLQNILINPICSESSAVSTERILNKLNEQTH